VVAIMTAGAARATIVAVDVSPAERLSTCIVIAATAAATKTT
jgi:hypothetical protein